MTGTLEKSRPRTPKPPWLKVKLPAGEQVAHLKQLLRQRNLYTVCEEAQCPNLGECWQTGTATFMLMGDVCTRGCRFCAVKTGNPRKKLDATEPEKIAEAVAALNLDYVVLTSVNRDDLPDGGAGHFAQTIRAMKAAHPSVLVEVLIPDFMGDTQALDQILAAAPEVVAHNVETVARLTRQVRDQRATYRQSLQVLAYLKQQVPERYTKSALMLGIGETPAEIEQTLQDLRAHGVDIVTMGQYLQPSHKHLAVQEFVPPEQFAHWQSYAESLGFVYVAAGPLIRSSYKAGEYFIQNQIRQQPSLPAEVV